MRQYVSRSWSRRIAQFRVEASLSLLRIVLAVVVLIATVVILAWIGDFVLEDLDELVEEESEDSTDARTDPVYPVVFVEDAGYNTGTEGTGRVE